MGDDGLAGRRVGLIGRQPGESQQLGVPLTGEVSEGELIVTAFADRGELGRFEYSADNPFGSPDRPYVSAGVVVSQRVTIE